MDVISVLYAAARRGARECMELPQPAAVPQPQPVQQTPQTQQPVEEQPVKQHVDEPNPDIEDERPKRKKAGSRFFSKIKDFTSNFLNDDPYDDDFDDNK